MHAWMFLQLFATLVLASIILIEKRLNHRTQETRVYLLSFGIISLPVTLMGWTQVHEVNLLTGIQGIVGGLLFMGAAYFYYKSINTGRATSLAPVLRLTVVMELLLHGFLYADRLVPVQYMAAGLILLGAIVLAVRPEQGFKLDRSVMLMAGAAVLLAFGEGFTQRIAVDHSPEAALFWHHLGRIIFLVVMLTIRPIHMQAVIKSLQETDGIFWMLLIGIQLIRLFAGLLGYYAINDSGSAALIAALSGLRPAVTALFAWFVLHEAPQRREVIAISIVVAGTLVIFLS